MKRGRACSGLVPLDNAVLCLKMQASAIEEAGSELVAQFIDEEPGQDARALRFPGALLASSHPLCQMIGYTSSESTEPSITHNMDVVHSYEFVQARKPFWHADTLTLPVTCDTVLALDVFLDVAAAYSTAVNTATDPATLYFRYFGASVQIRGGWAIPYTLVRTVNPSALSDQRNAVFHVEPRQMGALRKASPGLAALLTRTTQLVQLSCLPSQLTPGNPPPPELAIGGMDILFQMSAGVHFADHRDDEAAHSASLRQNMAITVVWQVSPNGSSSLQMVGAPNAGKMEGPGAGHMFASDMYHRTEHTTAGTVKVTIFYTKVKSKLAKTAAKQHVQPVEEAAAAPESPEATKDEYAGIMAGLSDGDDRAGQVPDADKSPTRAENEKQHAQPVEEAAAARVESPEAPADECAGMTGLSDGDDLAGQMPDADKSPKRDVDERSEASVKEESDQTPEDLD
jgi:hypothetical protein